MNINWSKFKEIVGDDTRQQKHYIYRGQSNSNWSLTTSLHRIGQIRNHNDFLNYFNVLIPEVQEQIEAWDGSKRNLSDPIEMGQFMSFLQHNGFPTPLLDWTYSPYIAAYFAFEGSDHFNPLSDEIAIYSFDQKSWIESYKQTYLYDEASEHVTILRPTYRGNHKQMLQQGVFWFTNCQSPENHVRLNEKNGKTFLTKYSISVKERALALRELGLMGVTAIQLFPSIESVCKKAFESIATRVEVGPTPTEKAAAIQSLFKYKNILEEAEKAKRELEYINCPVCGVKLNPKNLHKHLKKQHETSHD